MERFNPPELRRLRALLRRQYGARGPFAEQVEAVVDQLAPTPGSRLAFLGRVHKELSLEHVGADLTSPGEFRRACERLTAELHGANAQPAPVARSLISWLLLLIGAGLSVSSVDFGEANLGRLAVLGPLCLMVCLPVILSPRGAPNPVAWAAAILSPILLAYLTNVHVTEVFLWGALTLQVGLLTGPLTFGMRRGVLRLIVGLELAVSALVVFSLSQGYDLQSAGVFSLFLVVLAVLSLVRLHHAGAYSA